MSDHLDREFLGKVVRLAKTGQGGERDNAERLVRKLCLKHGLSFNEVMNSEEQIEEFEIECKVKHERLLIQTICRFALMTAKDDIKGSPQFRGKLRIYFRTTKERYIETWHAFAILSRDYDREIKKMMSLAEDAFIVANDLYYQFKDGERRENKKHTKKEIEEAQRAARLASEMEPSRLFRAIEHRKNKD